MFFGRRLNIFLKPGHIFIKIFLSPKTLFKLMLNIEHLCGFLDTLVVWKWKWSGHSLFSMLINRHLLQFSAIDKIIKMGYSMNMIDERDPITEWEHAIGRRTGALGVVCVLAIIVGAMVAPIFGWWVKNLLYREYALYDDCEQKVKNTMKYVWAGLWTLALIAWVVVIVLG